MKIWVDADACPVVIKEILFRAAERMQLPLILVANQYINTPPSKLISSIQVSAGFDVADNEIVARVAPGDLVITADIPLADEVISKQAQALSPRGELYTKNNIKGRLNMRDFMDTLRSSGMHAGGPAAMNQSDRKAFASHLDRILARYLRESPTKPS
ncbi:MULTISPECIES: YaiI/YqxD family protein [unclassified Agarivorans]|uniref:YaiI/YqxD family protein n=1 Tax=unclassified Agarivorans TaxID=2636026 RepID=UPI003D7E4558